MKTIQDLRPAGFFKTPTFTRRQNSAVPAMKIIEYVLRQREGMQRKALVAKYNFPCHFFATREIDKTGSFYVKKGTRQKFFIFLLYIHTVDNPKIKKMLSHILV